MNNLPLHIRSSLSILYQEKHRHYHNLDHINQMLAVYDRLIGKYLDESAKKFNLDHAWLPFVEKSIYLSIWFHDAVYNPGAPSGFNERRSIALLQGLDEIHHIERRIACFAIGCTIRHTEDQVFEPTDDPVVNTSYATAMFLLDCDLLGMSNSISYTESGEKIRKEYEPFVSLNEFQRGRIKFLEAMLARKRIYYTETIGTSRIEQDTRLNLQDELRYLK